MCVRSLAQFAIFMLKLLHCVCNVHIVYSMLGWKCWSAHDGEKKDEKCKWKNGFYFPLSLLASLWQRAQISKEDKARAMSVCVHSSERANKQHQQQQQNEQWQ